MAADSRTRESWTDRELAVLERLDSPSTIQAFLDGMPYNVDGFCRSPREVLRAGRAHCMDGALFAAAALRRLGHRPLVMDLRAVNDDDHVIALYRDGNLFGAVAKSNTTLLRARDPIFRSLREIALSYFPFYFNTHGEMSLRSYSVPLDLRRFDDRQWMFSSDSQEYIGTALDRLHHVPLVSDETARGLARAPRYLVEVCFEGSDPDGLFQPDEPS